MARIWDCNPMLLNRKHLIAEHKELGQLVCDMLKLDAGQRGRFSHHYEAKRFAGRYGLLIARDDFLIREASRRGYGFVQDWITYNGLTVEELRGLPIDGWRWREWASAHNWPRSYHGQYWAPWKRDLMTLADYGRIGNHWSRAYHSGARPDPDPFNVPVLQA